MSRESERRQRQRENTRARASFLADQTAAAAGQAREVLDTALALLPGYEGREESGEGGGGLGAYMVETVTGRWAATGGATCGHVDAGAPDVWVLYPVTRPVLCCRECMSAYGLAWSGGGLEKWRCDVCGLVNRGECRDRLVQAGNVMIPFGTCGPCERRFGWRPGAA